MFDGVPDQFHQFLVASSAARTTTLPLHLSFPPLHNLASSNGFTSFDPLFTSNSLHHHQAPPQLQQPHFLHPLHHQHQPLGHKNEEKEENTSLVLAGMNMEIERERTVAEQVENHHPWSDDEVLALLRIRSSMQNWFPEFRWAHVARKMAELGFKRSAEKCKEKFEEENGYFNPINCSKNYRIFSELEQLCQGENPPPLAHHHNQQVVAAEKNQIVEKSREDEDNMGQDLEDDSRTIDEYQTSAGNNSSGGNEKVVEKKAINNKDRKKKKKRQKKFEMLKGLCVDIVNKLMTQQEEMHNKLLEDMVKRDKEKVAREEAWKKQELDRINQELELREKEQAIADDRQATMIKFLSKFSTTGSSKRQCYGGSNTEGLVKVPNVYSNPPSTSSSSMAAAQNPNPIVNHQNKVDQLSITTSSTMILGHQKSGSCPTQNNQIKPTSMAENQAPQNPNPQTPTSVALAPQNPNSVNSQSNSLPPTSPLIVNKAPQNPTSNEKEDLGKRWPRDEVLALINLRCSCNNGDHDKEGVAIKTPLWERISQGMLELGYKRSAKRCKEKWENINKYFRKTKDINKKRSLDSRTCPYFHQLCTLYNQGTLKAPSQGPENRPASPENHSDLPETGIHSSQRGAKDSTVHVSEGDQANTVQVPAFEFEF